MLPERINTLLTSLQGPFTVVKSCSPVNYIIDIMGHHKVFPIDMLKKYHSREEDQVEEISTPKSNDVLSATAVTLIDDIDEEGDDGFHEGVPFPIFQQTETWRDIYIDNDFQGQTNLIF